MGAGIILSQRIVSLAPPPATPDLVFSDFSSGVLSPFVTDGAGGTTSATVISDPTGSGRGKVVQFSYADSNDANRWIFPDSDPFPKTHLFFAADLYIPTSTPNFTNPAIQRKLIYCRTEGNPIIAGIVISAWGNTLNYVLVNSVDQPLISTGQTITTNTWHRLEYEVQMNTSPSLSNGIFRIWWDGTQLVNRTDARFYSQTLTAAGYPYDYYSIGYQVEDGASWTEVRYWDNVGFATTRIGP